MSGLELPAIMAAASAGAAASAPAVAGAAATTAAVAAPAVAAAAAPSFLTMAAPYLSLGAGLISGAGQVFSGMGQSNMAAYNAEVARRSADAALLAGKWEYGRRQEAGEQLLSKQRATYGASGVELEGSPLMVMAETAAKVERDALAAKYGYQVKAAQSESQANLMEMQGSTALWSGMMGGATSLLQGAWQGFGKSPLTLKT